MERLIPVSYHCGSGNDRRTGEEHDRPLSTAALGITGAGTLYSGWLTYLELYVIAAICQRCVACAIVTTLLFVDDILILRRLWAGEDDAEYFKDADFA